MTYKPFINSTENPYHVTSRTINKEWFGLSRRWVWELLSEQLYFIHHAYGVKIHAFVLMSNHYHLIISTPRGNLSQAMNYLQSQSSRVIVKEAGRINQLWAHRFKRCEINTYHYYLNAYKYLYCNPVKAKMSARCELYPWSTLSGLLGSASTIIPLEPDPLLLDDIEGTLNWINQTPQDFEWESVRKALKKKVFTLPRGPSGKHPLEKDRL